MHVTDQVLSIYAGTHGHLDKVPLKEVHAWEEGFLKFIREEQKSTCGRRSPTPSNSTTPRPPRWSRRSPSSRNDIAGQQGDSDGDGVRMAESLSRSRLRT